MFRNSFIFSAYQEVAQCLCSLGGRSNKKAFYYEANFWFLLELTNCERIALALVRMLKMFMNKYYITSEERFP